MKLIPSVEYLSAAQAAGSTPDFSDDLSESCANVLRHVAKLGVTHGLHRSDWVNSGYLNFSVGALLENDVASQQGSNFVFRLEGFVSHFRIAGAQDAVKSRFNVQF